ncbi:SpoIVB peptidase S55 domain-containing protein [Thermomonospora echinospora]|uniref:SpoIVB peptidase S55 domain-containing protein n=1 Tax=Thermomonospora echinospora TaxID=1992 RepID=UPI000CDEFFD6|nr:SpoIVB peptidase S55 domain-containing protein [Thermomonospora echinospora]
MHNSSRHAAGLAIALAVAAPLAVSTPVTAHARTAPAGCPAPYPVAEVGKGMTGWGLTVSKGTTPERFTVKVQGVLKDGIAPGVDMILAEADSPALDAAGSIWAGMSGSPVYSKDGRLLGAVGYGFSGTSKLAGITPAKAMYGLLSKPEQVAAAKAAGRVTLPASMQRELTSRGLVGAKAAAAGLSRLPLPVGVSGLSQKRVNALNAALARKGSEVRLYRTGSASGAKAQPGTVVPGGNFGVLQSYGTVTQGAIGTTTAVCDGRALAFGHPYFLYPGGPVRLTAVAGEALSIVPDSTFGAFKLANFSGVAGTLTQDRHTGVVSRLGAGPAVTPIVSRAAADGTTRNDTTYVSSPEDVPSTATLHLWAAVDQARDQVTGGTTTATWTVRGTAAGKPWEITLGNRYSDRGDATYDAGMDIAGRLDALADNPYTAVKFTDLRLNAAGNSTYGKYTVAGLLVKRNGTWVALNPNKVLPVTAGKKVVVRVRLTAFRAPARTVDVRFTVPKKRSGTSGTLSIAGGLDESKASLECLIGEPGACADDVRAKSFPDLLAKLKATPRNDHLVGSLVLGSGKARATVRDRRLLDRIVGGGISLDVEIR